MIGDERLEFLVELFDYFNEYSDIRLMELLSQGDPHDVRLQIVTGDDAGASFPAVVYDGGREWWADKLAQFDEDMAEEVERSDG